MVDVSHLRGQLARAQGRGHLGRVSSLEAQIAKLESAEKPAKKAAKKAPAKKTTAKKTAKKAPAKKAAAKKTT